MTIHFTIPLAVAVAGAIGYLILPGKGAELSKYAFAAGLLAAMLKIG